MVGHRVVALKCTEDIFRSREDAKRALREAAILTRCNHPNVVRCERILTPPHGRFSCLWLVLEHCEWDLRTVMSMQMRCWTVPHIELLLHHLLRGLAYLHDHGICHRDLKPANILLNELPRNALQSSVEVKRLSLCALCTPSLCALCTPSLCALLHYPPHQAAL